jgi:eukaryotic-like serine/threonine-protein kinase
MITVDAESRGMSGGLPNRSSVFGAGPATLPRPAATKNQYPIVMGRYQLMKFLGEGSNAQVYLANDLKDRNRSVCVKRIKEHVLQNPKFRQFFAAEIQSMVKFVHPYSVQLFDASLDDPVGPVLVMELIRGKTLEEVMNRVGRVDIPRIARFVGPLCHALHAAQKAGIAHRDLKPANLMVTDAGTSKESMKVMDFGFASFAAKPHIQLSEITGHGQVFAVGTPAYVSPEMIRGDAVDARADIYAVGVMLFEMMTGRLPFDYNNVDQILSAHVNERVPRFHKIGSAHITPEVEAVVQTALSKYPNERYQTAKELAQAFENACGVRLWEETRPSTIPDSINRPPDSVVRIVASAEQSQTTGSPFSELYTLHDSFEANLSERLAAAKLRGFTEDIGGEVFESDPGLIRMHLGAPLRKKSKSKIVNWFTALRGQGVEKGKEPIELTLSFSRIDPSRVHVNACFMPIADYMPCNPILWRERCEVVYDILRQYLMASGSNEN